MARLAAARGLETNAAARSIQGFGLKRAELAKSLFENFPHMTARRPRPLLGTGMTNDIYFNISFTASKPACAQASS